MWLWEDVFLWCPSERCGLGRPVCEFQGRSSKANGRQDND